MTVTPPQGYSPGNGSPGAAVEGEISALASAKTSVPSVTLCNYQLPSAQAACKSGMAQAKVGQLPYDSNAGIGWVAVNGTEALVETTGTYCTPGQTPECFTNSNQAALLSSGKTFAQLWSAAQASAANAYSLAPCEEIGGKWYIYSSS